jgi:hypothetical protein
MQACHIIKLPPHQIIRYNPYIFLTETPPTQATSSFLYGLATNILFLFDRSSLIARAQSRPSNSHSRLLQLNVHASLYSARFGFFSSSYSS